MASYNFSESLKSLTDPFKSLFKKPVATSTPSSLFTPASSIKPPVTPAINYSSMPPNASTNQGPKYFAPPVTPQVNASRPPVVTATAPTPSKPAGSPVLPKITPPNTFTTPSGAKVDAQGNLLTPPPQQNATGTQESASGATSTPAIPSVSPESLKAQELAQKAYDQSLKLSPDELSTQEDIDKLVESTKTAFRNTSNQAIPLEFITGQLSSIERRATGLAEPLERKLARLQATRTSSLEASKFALDRADKVVEAERARIKPMEVSPGSSLTRYNPTTGKYENVFTAPKPVESKAPTTIETAQGIMQWDPDTGSWKSTGFTKPASATFETKATEKAEKEVAAQQQASQSIGIINNLLAGDRYKAISGAIQTGSIPFFGDRAAVNEYEQLQASLKLGIRSLIKGQGQVSDYEGKILGSAASALSRLTNEQEMKSALLRVRGVLKTNQGMETPVNVTNPTTGETITVNASGQEIYNLVAEGNEIEYL